MTSTTKLTSLGAAIGAAAAVALVGSGVARCEPLAKPLADPATDTAARAGARVKGYFDSGSGTFQTLDKPAASVTRNGTIAITGTIYVNGGIPTSTAISAAPTISTTDNVNTVSGNGTLTRTGPHTATVSFSLPYTWEVPAGAVSVDVTVGFYTSVSSGSVTRSYDSSWTTTTTLPPNGQTLTLTAHGAL